MVEVNPPGWLQNAGATHTAEQMRSYVGALIAGNSGGATSLKSRGGVHPTLGSQLLVQQTGTPSMAVEVTSGAAWVPGSEGSKQGCYGVLNDATKTVSIAVSHATLNRIDLIVFKVEDSQYSGSNNVSSIVAVTGTPASSPSPPTAPNNSLILAQVAVNAAVTSVTNANITDKRIYLAGAGGAIFCTSANRPAVADVGDGQLLWVDDLDRFEYVLGSSYLPLGVQAQIFKYKTADQAIANQATPQNDIHLFASVEANAVYKFDLNLIHNSASTTVDLSIRFTFPTGCTMHHTIYGPDLPLPAGSAILEGKWLGSSNNTTSPSGNVTYGSSSTGIATMSHGVLIVGGTPGTFQFQFSQRISDPTPIVMLAGSYLELVRVA